MTGPEPVTVPEVVRSKGGDPWVRSLPATVAALEERWGITVGAALPSGTSAYVARARTATGQEAVLKLSVPGVGFDQQVRTLVAADGRGYVRVLDTALDLDAVLLEPLGGSLSDSALPAESQLDVVAGLLPVAWQVPTEGRRARDKAAELIELVEDLRSAGPGEVVDAALRYAERRSAAFDPEGCVVVHGDAAAGNVLHRPGGGWVFVDPDGFLGDPDYDRGVALRDWCRQLGAAGDPGRLLESYGRRLRGDRRAVWEWAFVERVSTGLYLTSLGGDGRPHLDTAAALLRGSPEADEVGEPAAWSCPSCS